MLGAPNGNRTRVSAVKETKTRSQAFALEQSDAENADFPDANVHPCARRFSPVYWTRVGHARNSRFSAVPRTIRDNRFDSREARKKLKPSGKPYYRLLDKGIHFGYRKGRAGGSWVVRVYKGEQQYVVETIGQADDGAHDADGERILDFAQGQAKAREVAASLLRGETRRPAEAEAPDYTVRRCVAEYLEWMEAKRKSASDARSRADALILPTLGNVPCADLSKEQIEAWLNVVAKSPARLRSKKTAEGVVERQRFKEAPHDDEAKRKRRATANRTLTILKAALNRAWRDKKIASDDAWRRVEPFEEADAARVRYLTIAEAQRLINACSDDFRLLVRAALATGARYGELAALKVGDFNPDSAERCTFAQARAVAAVTSCLPTRGSPYSRRWPQAGLRARCSYPRQAAELGSRRIRRARCTPPAAGARRARGELPLPSPYLRVARHHERRAAPRCREEPRPYRHSDGREALRPPRRFLRRRSDPGGCAPVWRGAFEHPKFEVMNWSQSRQVAREEDHESR